MDKSINGSSRAALEQPAVSIGVGLAQAPLLQEADIANPRPGVIYVFFCQGAGKLSHLEWKTGWREEGCQDQLGFVGSLPEFVQDGAAELGFQSGFLRQGKCGSHLDSLRPGRQSVLQFFPASIASCQPKGHACLPNSLQIGLILPAVDGLTLLIDMQRSLRAGIVTAGGMVLDDEEILKKVIM